MLAREPLIRSVTFVTFVLAVFWTYPYLGDLDVSASTMVLASAVTGFVASVALTFAYHGAARGDKFASLQGVTERGLSVPLWKLPLQTIPLPLTVTAIEPAWFEAVPEIVEQQRRRQLTSDAIFNGWCRAHGEDSVYVRLASRVLRTLASQPDFPAAAEPGVAGHGGRSLLAHSLLVANYCVELAPNYQFDPNKFSFKPADPTFTFEQHRKSPLIFLIGLAHDLGKLTAFVPTGVPGTYIVVKHHDRETAFQLARMEEFWELPTADRDTLAAVVGHYHAETKMPIAKKGRAIDDLRHALVFLLIQADTKAGFEESAYARSATARGSLSAFRNEASSANPADESQPPSPVQPRTIATEARPPRVTGDLGSAAPQESVVAAVAHQQDAVRRLSAAVTPRDIKTAASNALRAEVAVQTLLGDNPLVDIMLDILRQPGRINGVDKNVGIRNFDVAHGAQLLVVVEAALRSAISLHPRCPTRFTGEGGKQRSGVLSPLTAEILAACQAKAWLWHPHKHSTDEANTHALYRLLGNSPSRIFANRPAGLLKPPFDVIRDIYSKGEVPFQPGAGFYLRIDNDPSLRDLVALPEHAKYVLAGKNIYGARGTKPNAVESPPPPLSEIYGNIFGAGASPSITPTTPFTPAGAVRTIQRDEARRVQAALEAACTTTPSQIHKNLNGEYVFSESALCVELAPELFAIACSLTPEAVENSGMCVSRAPDGGVLITLNSLQQLESAL